MQSRGFNLASNKGNMHPANACGCMHGQFKRNHNRRSTGWRDGPLRNSTIHRAVFRWDASHVQRSAPRHRGIESTMLWVARISEIAKAGKSRSWQVTAAPGGEQHSQHAAWSFSNHPWSHQGGPPRALGREGTRRSPAVAGMRSTVCI